MVESQEPVQPVHVPVMLDEALRYLRPERGQVFIDGTVGLGGHAKAILERIVPSGRLLGLDADPEALTLARQALGCFGNSVSFVQGRHRDLARLALREGFGQVDGILLDLGISTLQLRSSARGFSFQEDGPLDMRMGPDVRLTADEIVNDWPETELARIIWEYGEERYSRRIARAIVANRPIGGTLELSRQIERTVRRREKIHPATRTFQALRIAVNDELESLRQVLGQAADLLGPSGRLVVISFHSLEDRIVKQFMVRESSDCICPPGLPQCVCEHSATLERLTKKPIRPCEDEIQRNPPSRSARLRAARRLAA